MAYNANRHRVRRIGFSAGQRSARDSCIPLRSRAVKNLGFRGRALGIAVLCFVSQPAAPQFLANARPYLQLVDRLDRPDDGYCIDIAGSGDWVDLTVPLAAHNCKGPAIYPDQAVTFDKNTGRIRFPAYNVCVTALGRARRSLAHMPLMVRPCAEDVDQSRTPFSMEELQTFVHRKDGRLELKQSDLCLVVGSNSDTTFSASDRWRALFLDNCAGAPNQFSKWRLPSP